jgi:hypothetical protein
MKIQFSPNGLPVKIKNRGTGMSEATFASSEMSHAFPFLIPPVQMIDPNDIQMSFSNYPC